MTSSENAWPPPEPDKLEVLFNCPWCNQGSHGMTQVTGQESKPPRRGSPMICPVCGGVMIHLSLREVRKPLEDEWATLNRDPSVKAQRLEVIRASRSMMRNYDVIDFVALGDD